MNFILYTYIHGSVHRESNLIIDQQHNLNYVCMYVYIYIYCSYILYFRVHILKILF